jgi:hypothetical protein
MKVKRVQVPGEYMSHSWLCARDQNALLIRLEINDPADYTKSVMCETIVYRQGVETFETFAEHVLKPMFLQMQKRRQALPKL